MGRIGPEDALSPKAEGADSRALERGPDLTRDEALVKWLVERHGRTFSAPALRSALPAGTDLSTPAGLAHALAAFGLAARLVEAASWSVDPGALPCVIFGENGDPAILVEIGSRGRELRVLEPGKNGLETTIGRANARRTFQKRALLVAKTNIAAKGPGTLRDGGPKAASSGWFWRPVRENWGAWVQVAVAAACLNLLNFALPIFVMNVYDRVIPNLAFVTLWTLAAGVGIALALDFALRALRSGILERIARRVDIKASGALFEQALAARLTARKGGAAAIANTIREFETMRDFFSSASFVALIDLLFIGLFIAALFLVVGPLAYVPLLAIPAVLVLALLAQAPLQRSAAEAQALASKRHVVLVESLLGIEAIKSLGGEPVMRREWEDAIAASSRVSGQTRYWSGLAASGTAFIQQIVSVAVIVWGVFLVADGQITIGALIAANILAGRVLAPLAAISQTVFRANYAIRAMRSLDAFMALPRERSHAGASDLEVREGRISFRSVSFRYPVAEHPALDHLSFDIQPGERVALLGRVGSGKTTTGKILNGLLAPDDGNVLVDGHGIAQFDPAALREGIGYLTQESELFTGTLRENMLLGRPKASDEEIRAALALAGMDGFVAASSEGLDHDLGEKGSHLSGGQRQGVALARLLLRRPRVLFLDEPTNAMDQQMEAEVTQRLRAIDAGRTTLIFSTHRMSLADIANRFIVLDRGRKVLDGPKVEVLDKLRAARGQLED